MVMVHSFKWGFVWLMLFLIGSQSVAVAECAASLTLSAKKLRAILDNRFLPLTANEQPGFGVLVIQNQAVILAKSYGLADLESHQPINADSRFYIASMSKQFTAALIAHFILEGRMSLDDKVTRFLPELSPTYNGVTISNLLFHTGGVREYTSMMLIRGDDINLEGHMNTESAYHLIKRQVDLDFQPGTEYRYSSSGYIILAKIIEHIEQKPFAEVADHLIFSPLNMKDTLFDSDHSVVVPSRVKSYKPHPTGGWKRWLKHFDVVGDGGILTTMRDMALWDNELTTGAHFGTEWRNLMLANGKLSNGQKISYGYGLWQTEIMGQNVYAHGGGMGGFISDQIRIPALNLAIYVFANRNDSDAFQGWAVARELIEALGADKQPSMPGVAGEKPRARDYSGWLGGYFSDALNNRFFLREGPTGYLVLHGGGDQWMADLHHTKGGGFRLSSDDSTLYLLGDDTSRHIEIHRPTRTILAQQYDSTPPYEAGQLQSMAGSFWSQELESLVCFTLDKDIFSMRYAQGEREQLFPVLHDTNVTWNSLNKVWTGRSMVKFSEEIEGKRKSVTIGDGRVTGINFRRIDGLISCN